MYLYFPVKVCLAEDVYLHLHLYKHHKQKISYSVLIFICQYVSKYQHVPVININLCQCQIVSFVLTKHSQCILLQNINVQAIFQDLLKQFSEGVFCLFPHA